MRPHLLHYQIASPVQTHTRPATCDEVNCRMREHGWRTVVDTTTDLGQAQEYYIRNESGRRFTEDRDEAGRMVFTFFPGQDCFAQHRVSLERPELYLVRSVGGTRRHDRPEHWVEDFAENQDRIRAVRERG